MRLFPKYRIEERMDGKKSYFFPQERVFLFFYVYIGDDYSFVNFDNYNDACEFLSEKNCLKYYTKYFYPEIN